MTRKHEPMRILWALEQCQPSGKWETIKLFGQQHFADLFLSQQPDRDRLRVTQTMRELFD